MICRYRALLSIKFPRHVFCARVGDRATLPERWQEESVSSSSSYVLSATTLPCHCMPLTRWHRAKSRDVTAFAMLFEGCWMIASVPRVVGNFNGHRATVSLVHVGSLRRDVYRNGTTRGRKHLVSWGSSFFFGHLSSDTAPSAVETRRNDGQISMRTCEHIYELLPFDVCVVTCHSQCVKLWYVKRCK